MVTTETVVETLANLDLQLVRQAKAGDKESFTQLYEQMAAELYKVALFTVGSSFDAEDVVSDTFLEAYKGIHSLRDEGSFRPWIMRILHIRCKRKIREIIGRKSGQDIDEFYDLPAPGAAVEELIEQRTAVGKAMQALSYEERLIVTLSVLEGYTIREIAQVLGHPQGTVSSKLHRTLAKLRKALS